MNQQHVFEQHANQWWDSQGPYCLLHRMTPLRLAYLQRQCHLKQASVLDVGCGGGLLAEAMAYQGAQVTAIDIDEQAIAVATQHALQQQLTVDYQCVDIQTLLEHPARYDLIVCSEVLEHVDEPARVIQAAAQLLNDSGCLVVTTINRTWWSYLGAICLAEQIGWAPAGAHEYQQLIQPAEMVRYCQEASLQVGDMVGIRYHALTQGFSFADDLSINYALTARKASERVLP